MIKLKTIFAIIGITLLCSVSASAQIGDIRNNIAIGVNGGVNYNTVSFEKHRVQQKGLFGPNIGLTARYISEKYFAMICGVQIELNYSQRGWDKKFELNDGSGDTDPTRGYTRKMNYLELPFLAHLAFGKDLGAQFFINIGPQIGYLISSSESHFGLSATELESEEYGMPFDKKFDYGIAGGLGVEIKTKRAGNFLIEGRYYFGLADFYNSNKKDYFSRSANSSIIGKITYLFDIKK